MKISVPEYYKNFSCIKGECKHTCCAGFEIDIDEESLPRFLGDGFVSPFVEMEETPHIKLDKDEKCHFLNDSGLCEMIIKNGEDFLCQICRDHPRFRNYFTDREEIGLGLVCEEAGRIILGSKEKLKLEVIFDDGKNKELSFDEQWLLEERDMLLDEIEEEGPLARLKEYLIFRHISNALYDDKFYERLDFIEDSFKRITDAWEKTDGSFDSLVECARAWSFDVEYNEGVIEEILEAKSNV